MRAAYSSYDLFTESMSYASERLESYRLTNLSPNESARLPLHMKRFEELFAELQDKVASQDPDSGTVKAVQAGPHAIGKKVLEEAGEVWMAAEHEGRERTAEEISQLLYHLQCMMLACDIDLDDVYEHL